MDKISDIRERHDAARCFISDNFDSAEERRVDYFMTRHVIRKQYGDVQFLLSEYDRLTELLRERDDELGMARDGAEETGKGMSRSIEDIKANIAETEAILSKRTSTKFVEANLESSLALKKDALRAALTKNIPLSRLEEICAAEKDGRCVVLPCKVGADVFRITPNPAWDSHKPFWEKNRPEEFKTKKYLIVPGRFTIMDYYEIGKTVFLTRAEAEAAMKEKNYESE